MKNHVIFALTVEYLTSQLSPVDHVLSAVVIAADTFSDNKGVDENTSIKTNTKIISLLIVQPFGDITYCLFISSHNKSIEQLCRQQFDKNKVNGKEI
jgi:hypothetical protein